MWKLSHRLALLALLLATALWLPWWLFVALGLFAVIAVPHFYEGLIAALWFDALYGASGVGWFGVAYLATALGLAAVFVVDQLRPYLHFPR